MSPAWSMVILPIQRVADVGAKVPCWKTVGVPLGLRISYQRIPVLIECVTTSASWPSGNFRQASRYIRRSPSESKGFVVDGCGTHTPPLQSGVNEATAKLVGPVNVEFAGVAKSTWNFHIRRALVVKSM